MGVDQAPVVSPGFHRAADDIGVARRLVVAPVESRYPLKGGAEAMSINEAAREVAAN